MVEEQDYEEISEALDSAIEEMLDKWEDGLDKPKIVWVTSIDGEDDDDTW